MDKNFDQWNEQKKKLNKRQNEILFHEREIWWCSLGVNVGSEQDGKNDDFSRPILVLKKFSRGVLLVVPLTSRNKYNKYYQSIKYHGQESWVILSQIRLISSQRLTRKAGVISHQQFKKVNEKIKSFFS